MPADSNHLHADADAPLRRCSQRVRRFTRLALTLALVGAFASGATGCIRRTITISSDPAGALCWLNGREVGRTPVTVEFLYYGTYDVQLTHEGYEPLLTIGQANAPLWDTIPFDLASELWPGEPHADLRWHYVLDTRSDDREALVIRAEQLREKLLLEAPIPPGSPEAVGQTPPLPTTAPSRESTTESLPESAPATPQTP